MDLKDEIRVDDTISISAHATSRAQQRGVKKESVILTALHGEIIDAVGGCARRTMTRKVVIWLEKAGGCPKLLEESYGTVVITLDEIDHRVVLTVRPSEKQGKRRGGYLKPKPMHHFPESRAKYRNMEYFNGGANGVVGFEEPI